MKHEKIVQILEDNAIDALVILSQYNRRYLSGFTGSHGALVINKDNQFLITDFRYMQQAALQAENFEVVQQKGQLLESIKGLLKSLQAKSVGFEGDLITFSDYSGLKGNYDLVDISGAVEKARMIKEPFEIKLIQEAADIADETYEHILKFVKAGMTEMAVNNELEMHMRKLGATSSSFDIIVASGHRGALPHGVATDKVINSGEMVTIDYGALYKGYISDITRTFAVGEPSAEMKRIYDVVLESQIKGLEEIKPGMSGKTADALVRKVIADAGYGENFGHSLGHGIGLQVHELPGLSGKSEAPLEVNMCVTVEPGIYVDGLGGVRIEDDALVTENGLKRFTHSTKDLIIL